MLPTPNLPITFPKSVEVFYQADSFFRRRCRVLDTLPTVALASCLISHSHTTMGNQPAFLSKEMLVSSRRTFASNLLLQNADLDFGVYAYLHPGCRCQKQPWTKTTALYLGKTISGFPGSLLSVILYLYPKRWSIERTASSGLVFFPRMSDIFQLRFSGDSVSMLDLHSL